MSSTVKVKSPYFEENSGDSVIYAYEFSHEKEIREVTFTNNGLTSISLTVNDSLVAGSVSMGPIPFPTSLTLPSPDSYGNLYATSYVKNDSDESEIQLGLSASDGYVTSSSDFLIGTVSFFKNSFQEKTSRNIDYLYNVNKNGEYIVKNYDSPILESQASVSLLRTNPKLTGNVKITVDSLEKIWLNSIDANKELSDSRFKKFPVSANSNLAIDVYKFFDEGQTPPEIVYDLYQQASSYFSTQRSFSGQYDRFYTYGAEQLKSRFYEEDFSFFAPIRIGEILPEYFVIFKADGPLNDFTYSQNFTDWKNYVNSEILKKADIVKVYDLSENSRIGKYIRNLKNHPARKESEMTVSFQRDGYTTFNGISYTEGSFAQKGELLADFFAESSTIIGTEQFLTLGFQRNKILSGSILNLEFLFDDPDSEEYSINRYFGFYLRKNEIASFFLSDKALEQYSLQVGQTPLPRRGVDGNKLSSRSFVQTNTNGIKLYVNTSSIERTNNVTDVFTTKVESLGATTTSVYFAGEWVNNPLISEGDSLSFSATGSTAVKATATILSIEQEDKRAKITLDNLVTIGVTFSSLTGYNVDFYTEEKEERRKLDTFSDSLISDSSRLFYLQDKRGNFYNVNGTKEVITKVNNFTFLTDVEIQLNEKRVDISNFTGVDEMLSQTEAELMTSSGYSVMELELTESFKDFDYIEISSLRSQTEPLRWRIKAQSPLLQPGQFWPDYSIVTDVDGSKYYTTFFHPGNSQDLTDLASSIVGAFNTFPFRVFDVVNKDNKIYFRSVEPGDIADSLQIHFSLQKNSLKVYGWQNPIGSSSVSFMGGSDRTKNRVKISRQIAEGILPTEYFQTVGNYSKLKSFDVFGNPILYFSYLEKPSYNNLDEIDGFSGVEDYAVIELEDDSKFQLTHDNKITSYSIHRSRFGIFSFFPLRDFDTDDIVSDYGKNYDAELTEYFYNIGAKSYVLQVDPTNPNNYYVSFPEQIGLSGDYSFLGVYEDSRTPRDYNGSAILSFPGPTATIATLKFYRGSTGSGNVEVMTGLTGAASSNVPSKLVILPGDKIFYFEENLLSKFKGFFSLSPVITSQDMRNFASLESQWNFSRFFLNKISSEYLRLQELYLKDWALVSKVVPYINKWVSPYGKDIRDNPYRLNYSRAFGTMNFSPSGEFPDADTKNHTHEWPYLANVPKDIDPVVFSDFCFSYFFEKPDFSKYDFYSADRDWFSEFFVVGYPSEIYTIDSEENLVPIETSERYSIFKYDDLSQKTYTIFRGIRLEIGETLSADGAVLIGSEKYIGYKFSSVIVPVTENDFLSEKNVEFDVIVNEKFKFILNIIKVKISSYKNPEGNLNYIDLYTMENKRNVASYVTDSSKISPSGSSFRYSRAIPSDIEFPTNFLPLYSGGTGFLVAPNYFKEDLRDYVNLLSSTGLYSYPYSIRTSPSGLAEFGYSYSNISLMYSNKAKLNSKYFSLFNPGLGLVSRRSFQAVFNESIPTHKFYYASGGDSYYNRVRNSLSFYEISRILEKTSTEIDLDLVTVSRDGSIIDNKIIFRVVTPDRFYQQVDYSPISDENKPSELYNYSVIGADLKPNLNPEYLYRYQGDFVPKLKDVFFYGSREQEKFAIQYNSDFKLANTLLAESLENTYYLRNQYFSKVADEEILRISQSSAYKSVYPLVSEISIDRGDSFIWNSSWDKDYYRKYSTVSQFSYFNGTDEMQEIKSFLGSKMMKIKKEFSLYEFTLSGEFPEIVYTENGNLVTVDIDVYSKFLRELMGTTSDEKARKEFAAISETIPSAIDPADVYTLTESYIKKNIIQLFEIGKVNFYLLQTGNTGNSPGGSPRPLIQYNENSGVLTTLTESQLIAGKYIYRKDVKTTLLSNLKLRIEFPTDTRFYTSLGFGVNVRRI